MDDCAQSMRSPAKRNIGVVASAVAISAAALILSIFVPELLFFLIPAIILGIGTAFLLRRSGRHLGDSESSAGQRSEIDMAKIKVGGGVAGLIFTVGCMWIFLAGIPALWYFLALAIAVGAGVAIALRITDRAR
jgi:hypothetical protein